MATEFDGCKKALGTHVWESFKDCRHDLSKENDVEDVSLHPLRIHNGFASTSLSFLRKGDADDSSIEFTCTDTGTPIVSIFVRGPAVDRVDVPSILTRENVDEIVRRFMRTVFKPE